MADINSENNVYWALALGMIFVLRILYLSVDYYLTYRRPELTAAAAKKEKES